MTTVTFSAYNFRRETRQGAEYIFDELRKKWVLLTGEEWVRQHILHYLVYDKGYSPALIAVERGIELNGLRKRFDIVVFDNTGAPRMIVECKAPEELLNKKVFEQIARYNMSLKVDYLWVTNGKYNYCCSLKAGGELLQEVPANL
ncbi:MAG: type I restriction enzyme HsdR N-terminal domain-containing protein [Chitinophagales bacterium]